MEGGSLREHTQMVPSIPHDEMPRSYQSDSYQSNSSYSNNSQVLKDLNKLSKFLKEQKN